MTKPNPKSQVIVSLFDFSMTVFIEDIAERILLFRFSIFAIFPWLIAFIYGCSRGSIVEVRGSALGIVFGFVVGEGNIFASKI